MSTGLQLRQVDEMNLSELQTLGQVFTKSGFFADTKDAAQAVVKVMAGMELGFPPIASMTGVYIVKGKVSLSANLMAAAIKKSGKYNYRVRQLDDNGCKIEFFEDSASVGFSEFTRADAQSAGLAGSDTYKKFFRNMAFARAMSNGAKWYCPDIFGGPIYTPDELGAEVDGETGEVVEVIPHASEAAEDLQAHLIEQAFEAEPDIDTAIPRGREPEPVRPVKLEGAQPTDSKAQWPKAPGIVGQIFAKCQALNWTAANLADEIEKRFKMVIPEESVMVGLADALTLPECKTLDQALAAEFNNRSRTR